MSTNAKNVITDAPLANPSKPSVRLTPLLVAMTIKATQITTSTGPKKMDVSRTVDRFKEIGVNPSKSAN